MKKVLMMCLLGTGLLLQRNAVIGKASFIHRIVDVTLQGYDLQASSDGGTGTITQVKVYRKSTMEVVRVQSCSGYECHLNLTGLSAGAYMARVYTTMTTYDEDFKL